MNHKLSVISGAALSTAGNVIEYALGMLISVVIARSLGPDSFGSFSYAVWLAGTLIFFANHGIPVTTIRFTADACGRENYTEARLIGKHLSKLQWLSLVVTVGILLALLAGYLRNYWGNSTIVVVVLIAIAVVAKSRFMFLTSVALGYQRFRTTAAAPSIAAFTYLLLTGIVYLFSPSLEFYLGSYAGGMVAGFLFLFLALRMYTSNSFSVSPDLNQENKSEINKQLYLTSVLAMLTLLANRTVETFLLGFFGSAKDIGFFAIAGTLTKGAVDILSSGMQSILMPVLAHRSATRTAAQVSPMFNAAMRYYWFAGLIIACCGYFLAEPAILIIYGRNYAPTIVPLQLTIVGAGLAIFGSVLGALLTTQNRQNFRVRIAAWSLAINLLLGLLLVPTFGLLGASLVFFITRIGSSLIALVYFTRAATINIQYTPLIRMLAAWSLSLGIGFVPYLFIDTAWTGFVSIALALILGPTFSILFKCWHQSDFELVSTIVEKLLPNSQHIAKSIVKKGQKWSYRLDK